MVARKKEKSEFGKRLDLALDIYNSSHAEKMTYADLGKHIDVTASRISDWNSGITFPSDQNIKKVSAILGIPADWLKNGTHEFNYPLSAEEYKKRIIEVVNEINDVAVLAGIADSIGDLLKLVPAAYRNGGFENQKLFQK